MAADSDDLKKNSYTRVPVSCFPRELDTVKAAQARGDALGYRLDRSKTIRLLLRNVDVDAIPEKAFKEIAEEVSLRRRRLKN